MTGATLFSGFGGADLGMSAAGVDVLWGIEIEDEIAEVARKNGLPIVTGDVTKVNPSNAPFVDVLHASPVCKSFSVAKAGRKELDIDRAAAEATVRFLEASCPLVFTLENVWGYRNSESWSIIYKALMRLGYGVGHAKMNAADYGVPQTRERMIVWAFRNGNMISSPTATHAENPPPSGLFGDVLPKWIGWYEAIEDLIPSLPESELAPWQLKRLPEELRTLLIMTGNTSDGQAAPGVGVCYAEKPANSVYAQPAGGMPRAVLVEQNANDTSGSPIEKDANRPAGTVRTGTNHVPRAVLVSGDSVAGGDVAARSQDEPAVTTTTKSDRQRAIVGVRVVQMTPRCLARFQSFPDSYELPESRLVACTGIGNAVPPLLQQRLYERLIRYAA